MRTFSCAAIILVAVAASAPFARNALAQAASTGGTVGKQDKSASGGEEPTAPKSQTHRSASAPAAVKPRSSGCGNLAGAYKWILGSTAIINANGTATNLGSQGRWTCGAGGQVTIVWSNGAIDHLTPTASGYSVVNNLGQQWDGVRL
jgi:hypothetical protein